MKRNIQTLAYLIERGRVDINTLSRKERKALEQSLAVSKQEREAQARAQVDSNEYMELELPEPKQVIKAERIGGEWGFSAAGFRHFIPVIESLIQGAKRIESGYLIYRVLPDEAVIYQQ